MTSPGCAQIPTSTPRGHGKKRARFVNLGTTRTVIASYETRHAVMHHPEFTGISRGTHLESVPPMTPGRSGGFTLIELMLVVGLIAVLAAATAPSIVEGMRRFEVTTASQQVASTIRLARYQAVGKNMNVRVRFNYPTTGQYQILDDADADVISSARLLLNGATFSSVDSDIQIDPQGRVTTVPPSGTWPVEVDIANSAASRTIRVERSGRVELQ